MAVLIDTASCRLVDIAQQTGSRVRCAPLPLCPAALVQKARRLPVGRRRKPSCRPSELAVQMRSVGKAAFVGNVRQTQL